jgi:hypothetical protein
MKKLLLLFVSVLLGSVGLSYTWNSVGPEGINASRLCFNVGLPYWVICVEDGMYLYNYDTHESVYYTYGGLPVTGAVCLDANHLIVVMGDGSYSDGIYRFDMQTHDFEVLEWIVTPTFLVFHEPTGTYWVGSQFGGMYKSSDGTLWDEVPFFNGKPCTCMDGYGEHMVVSGVSNIYDIYCSGDNGVTWSSPVWTPMITDLRFDSSGKLCGIFPDYSDSSGLWFSDDFGMTWDVHFYSDNMSAVGFDAFGNLFTGWESGVGIAIYNPLAPPPGLTFLNDGLASININSIQLNPTMSAPAIFVSTDQGAYYSYDYLTDVADPSAASSRIILYPNPVKDRLFVDTGPLCQKIEIISVTSGLVFKMKPGGGSVSLDVSHLNPGVYILWFQFTYGPVCKKIVVK